ncbi:hypothetical protein F511_46037 [Dorcoceras hygrometricum]|uniref:Uncharacterized protein n=1 Tax=Dorcoceras hygrometricum TaxID=472368 RepID=A0A2Z7A1W2_9LAMI|nr:hypothetical protein F511_46037 [Dorcoceras hygrometricum]
MKIQQKRRGASFGMSCDDISLDVITISRWSEAQTLKRRRVLNQQMKQSAREEATSYGDSAGGLVVDDVIGDVIQSQESAGSLHSRRKRKRRRIGSLSSRKLQCNQQMLLAIAKRCRLHKLIRQRFALAIKIQQEDFALFISADEVTVSSRNAKISSRKIDEPVASNSSIQSRAYLNQLLPYIQSQALHIQSTWFPGANN